MKTYASGSEVDLDFYFRNKAGALTDPAAATFYVEDGAGVITTYALAAATRLSVGLYELTIVVHNPTAETVRWFYRGEGTSGLICATLDQGFFVEPTRFD